mgnify:CR=1 FL=1
MSDEISSAPQDPLTSHEYDGIREYDNPTPGWWHAIFAGTVIFSFLYVIFWHVSVFGWSIHDRWKEAELAEFARIFGSVGQLKPDEGTFLESMQNPQFMAIARATYLGNCTACHGRDGEGLVGVNLCDDAYKNVKKIEDIFTVINEGAKSGAMPAWKSRFSENERIILAAYVASLRGTKPANPKQAEGEVIPPWPTHSVPVMSPQSRERSPGS